MLTLTLLRHAKSDWSDDTLDDFDRPLAKRGLKAAPVIGRELKKRGPELDLILCSTSKRTHQTLDLVLQELPGQKAGIHYLDDLYHALPDQILDLVRARADTATHVMVVGHNPGLHVLALRLAHDAETELRAAMSRKFPTAAFAQFQFEGRGWGDFDPAQGRLTHFITPRSLG